MQTRLLSHSDQTCSYYTIVSNFILLYWCHCHNAAVKAQPQPRFGARAVTRTSVLEVVTVVVVLVHSLLPGCHHSSEVTSARLCTQLFGRLQGQRVHV